jgi:catechol 2,3-dioxygenase-like lactoylglutathione lyase family enzyme
MIRSIDHIGILTDNLQESIEFYTDVLGFSISAKMEMDEIGLSIVFVEKNGSKIELMGLKNVPERAEDIKIQLGDRVLPINDHISFSVDDIEATVTQLKGKNVTFEMDPIELEGGMKLACLKDPGGVLIELVEHPLESRKYGST